MNTVRLKHGGNFTKKRVIPKHLGNCTRKPVFLDTDNLGVGKQHIFHCGISPMQKHYDYDTPKII